MSEEQAYQARKKRTAPTVTDDPLLKDKVVPKKTWDGYPTVERTTAITRLLINCSDCRNPLHLGPPYPGSDPWLPFLSTAVNARWVTPRKTVCRLSSCDWSSGVWSGNSAEPLVLSLVYSSIWLAGLLVESSTLEFEPHFELVHFDFTKTGCT